MTAIYIGDVLALFGAKHGMARALAALLRYGTTAEKVFPSIERIAADAKASPATVYSMLLLAEAFGLVARDKDHRPGSNWEHNVYRFGGLAAEFIRQHKQRAAAAVRRVVDDAAAKAAAAYKRQAARFQALRRRGKSATPPNSGDDLSFFLSNEKKERDFAAKATATGLCARL